MSDKKTARLRRAKRGRRKMRELGATRLTVYRSSRHIYAQVISPDGGRVLAQASTLDPSLRDNLEATSEAAPGAAPGADGATSEAAPDATSAARAATGNADAARRVGALIADRAKGAGVTRVAFDRSGYKYHGRVKALADAAREGGLEF